MWRSSRNIIQTAKTYIDRGILQQPHRCASGASTSGGGVAKALLWTTGALTVGASGTVAYAWYDPEFRRTIENNVPQSKDALQKILGEPRDSSKPVVDIKVKQIGDKISSIIPPRKEQPEQKTEKIQKDEKKVEPAKPVVKTEKDLKVDQKQTKEGQKESVPAPKPSPKTEPARLGDEKAEKAFASRDARDVELRKLQEAKAEVEEELRAELQRQSAAHSDHLVNVLRAQKTQLETQFQQDLDDALLKERDIFNRELGSSISRLNAIESALEGRAEQDSENRRAKELWLACQHLKKSVLQGRAEGRSYNARRKPLVKEIAAIKDAGAADPFVKTLLATINSEAVKDGVYTQDDLVGRFQRVKKVCRRTALIGENGGTLFQYALSALQSFFLFDRVKPDPKELQEVDPKNIDTVGILWRASHLVDQLNFEDAIKLMLLLKGEPARLASDWIKDARLHLETRRTAELLLAHASAVSMRTIY